MAQSLSVLPIEYHLTVPRATASTINLTFTDAAGTAIDITGDTITLTVRDAYGGTSKFTASGSITVAASGTATVSVSVANTTDGKTSGQTHWVYVITRTHGGVVTPWWGGRFTIDETAQ